MNKKKMYECLKNKIPLERNINEDFVDFINNHLADYLKLVENIFENDYRLDLVKEFILKSQKSLNCYFKGDINSSKQFFKEAIKPLIGDDDYNYNGILPIYNKNFNDIYFNENGSFIKLYRIAKYSESIWHIPFEKKDHASSGRFSASCLPCLYLSNNIKTCLIELDNPSPDDYFVSCFGFDYHRINVLDLTMPKINITENEEQFYDKAILSWPLVALCMIKKPIDKSSLSPEYIFSQYIIEMLSDEKNSKIRAVKYFSTKCADLKSFNIAIPARNYTCTGHCENIKNIFKEKDTYYSQYYKFLVSEPKKIENIDIESLQQEISDDNYRKIE